MGSVYARYAVRVRVDQEADGPLAGSEELPRRPQKKTTPSAHKETSPPALTVRTDGLGSGEEPQPTWFGLEPVVSTCCTPSREISTRLRAAVSVKNARCPETRIRGSAISSRSSG